MNTPRRAGVMAGAVLAVASLAGCNPEAKREAREKASTATDFAKYVALRCRVAMADSDKKITKTTNAVSLTHESSAEQTETCTCEGLPNPKKCSFTRGMQGAIGKEVTLTAEDHGLKDAERFMVKGTGDDGSLQKIHFVVKGDDCEVDGVSIDRKNCDAVHTAVVSVIDTVTAPQPPSLPAPAEPTSHEGKAWKGVFPAPLAPSEPLNHGEGN